MQIQSVGNIKSNIGFTADRNVDPATLFVNMNDDQLRYLAYHANNSKSREKRAQKQFLNTLLAIPIVDTLASGILAEKTPLSKRVSTASKVGITWGVIILGANIYNKVKRSIVRKDSPIGHFEQNHPFLSFFGDIAAIGTGFAGIALGYLKLKDQIEKKAPDTYKSVNQDIKRVSRWLDDTKANKNILPAFEEGVAKVADKAPFLAKTGEFALSSSVWILLGIGLYRLLKREKHEAERVENNYNSLKELQFQTSKHLINELGFQRDILAQNQQKLTTELERLLNQRVYESEQKTEEIIKHRHKRQENQEKTIDEEVNY